MEKDCGMWIHVLSHKLKKRMNADVQSLGITGVQSRIMHYILIKCTEGPVFQRDVENAFDMCRSTATGILQLMEKNGLILRENVASDARLKSLIPTKKAEQLDAQIGELLRQTERRLTQGLSDEQLALFRDSATRMSANLDE
ncbi:transcriptional regulator SlyA [uncultured Ruminococcus sp.]|uniref:Winged helix-turn-helix transcriptional regulator n=1 Tax=Massiliimalia timonensis TaxID=1987501 RepID=A0A8J6TPS3_9FIRM|nr:MarR family winged helix-turn-helix transcriptional regulator [Massiliimalia timonensis]MBC8610494.1 winged helix-turn-helix transcriptional regulator [Massiliimalia timonensis]SCH46394.1 transcriptional regulator SlyA [uncultured Ruminococcus sp.]SCI14274.1 transcriptional regulator SlyA [uncultured Clostridium sp.]